jgi:ribonuclease P protein component
MTAGPVKAYIMPNGLIHSRLGIVASKAVSKKAVVRNKIKRVIRHWVAHNLPPALRCSYDIVIVVKFKHADIGSLAFLPSVLNTLFYS